MDEELDELPPPAYTDTELDQKVQQAIQVSEKTRQPEEEWEQWDEAAFEAAASGKAARFSESYVSGASSAPGSSAQGSSSRSLPSPPPHISLPEVAPLRIRPRAVPSNASSSSPPAPAPLENEAHPYQHEEHGDDEADDDSIAPPPFTAVGPSLDGPPFEEVVRLSYNPSNDSPTPQSVAQSPSPQPTLQIPLHERYPLQHEPQQQRFQAQPARHSYPAPEFPPNNIYGGPQRVPSYMTSHKHAPAVPAKPAMPRLNFNPSMAYGSGGKQGSGGIMPQVQPLQPVDPMSFYNASVVSHMKPRTMQPIRSSQMSHQPLPRPPSAQSHFSQSTNSDRQSVMSMPMSMRPMSTASDMTYAPVPQYPPAPILGNNAQFPRYPQQNNNLPQQNFGGQARWASSESQYHTSF